MFVMKTVIAAAIVLGSLSALALAEDCRQYQGPARLECAKKNNPNFEARMERCKEEGERMGLIGAGNKHHEIYGFIQACMQRR